MIERDAIQAFSRAAHSPDPDLAVAALMIARIECPSIDAGRYLAALDELGREAGRRIAAARAAGRGRHAGIAALSAYLFGELGFVGNERQYDDPRNSCLNEVLDRRTGIPITLSLVYIEVGRRAGLPIAGVNFPGRFLVQTASDGDGSGERVIVDPFGSGALLTEQGCRDLLRDQLGDDAVWDHRFLGQATKPQILVRMLLNLKRSYVRMFSFPQARDVTELMLAIDPAALHELRDRGLLAYHMNDFSSALRDLQRYLQLSSPTPPGLSSTGAVISAAGEAGRGVIDAGDGNDEVDMVGERDMVGEGDMAGAAGGDEAGGSDRAAIWDHVKTLRKRVASLN